MQMNKKGVGKFLLLMTMFFSNLMSPIKVLAEEILNENLSRGDVGINNTISNDGESASVSSSDGMVEVVKTVSKTETLGRYKVEFKVRGEEVQSSTSIFKPLYAVIVFDKSGSMKNTCLKYERNSCIEYDEKWDDAVSGAKNFANILLEKIPSAKIALVEFSGDKGQYGYTDVPYNDASVTRTFENANFDLVDFGEANGGTNLGEGLNKAKELLDTITEDAFKYVVVIGDGEPTFYSDDTGLTRGTGSEMDQESKDYAINKANDLKKEGVEIFSIGYSVESNNDAQEVLRNIATTDLSNSDMNHFVLANPSEVANSFTNIANEISKLNAGTEAKLEDKLGEDFTLSSGNLELNLDDITSDWQSMGEFYIDIDQSSSTGWHYTNAGFELTYKNTNGEEKSIVCNENPEVYWVQGSGTVIATYKDIYGNELDSSIENIGIAGSSYTTLEKSFYGYTLTKIPENKDGLYVEDNTIYVDYIYSKNIGTSEEKLSKLGLQNVNSINSQFDYTIEYNTVINDYVGEANLVITDSLPYKIDLEKSVFSDNCKYDNQKIVCIYMNEISQDNNSINIREDFNLYYIDIKDREVLNKVEAFLTYGDVTKELASQVDTLVDEGKVIVNYVTKVNGEYVKLCDSMEFTGLVGDNYTTAKKEFDKYFLTEVVGDQEGRYTTDTQEVTYVYDLTPLPPQTGIDGNSYMYIDYIMAAIVLIIIQKIYKILKNN